MIKMTYFGEEDSTQRVLVEVWTEENRAKSLLLTHKAATGCIQVSENTLLLGFSVNKAKLPQ
jgi:hypothetical protein